MFESKGGFYHVIFLFRFLLFFGACSCVGLYVSLWLYPVSEEGLLIRGNGFFKYFFAG